MDDKSSWALVEQYNTTEDASTLGFHFPQVFERVAAANPRGIALICAGEELRYGELNTRANRLARVLIQHGVSCGDIVGIGLKRSLDLVIAILAVLKTGAAYVPVDPALPPDRVAHMMANAKPKLLVATHDTMAVFSQWQSACLDLDTLCSELSSMAEANLDERGIKPEDLAYIIYTSGSTGKPKGVEANHGALCNLMFSMQRSPGCAPGDRLLAVATISFDMSILDLLLPLSCGAAAVLAQTEDLRDASALTELMSRHAVTMIQATPSFFQMLMDGGWDGRPRLQKILTAGEPVSRRLLDRMLEQSDEVYNGYGPTEGTIYSSVGKVLKEDLDIVVGEPIANFQLYVLDPETLKPLPTGQKGELFIGGVGVNCGYHGNPELTRDRFLEHNPFHSGRLYRSGDLARFIGPGKLSIVGRVDHQVKVRGYRIELGDISSTMTQHKDVSAAVVLARQDQLIAYYVRKTQQKPEEDRDGPDIAPHILLQLERPLRLWLSERLPSYMVPDFYVEMNALPLTVNGKVDRKALPDPLTDSAPTIEQEKPAGGIEQQISHVWSKVLGHSRFGINDNFFHVGGNSLRVPFLKAELERQLGRAVPAAKIFEHYTIRALGSYLNARQAVPKREKQDKTARERQDSVIPDQGLTTGDNSHQATAMEAIAIVGMGCRLPGGVTTPKEYWSLLEQGLDAIVEVPPDRWDADKLYDADPDAQGKSYCRRGGFLDSDVESFDASFFGLSPREARMMDPSQHLMLEVCWEGLERAGYNMHSLRGSQTGVFIGHTNVSAHNDNVPLSELDGYSVTGTIGATLSGRISYALGLEGPSLTVDTACSSSLVATHLACSALRRGECDVAIAGGVTLMLTPGLLVEFSRMRGISKDGSCRAFSSDTEGTGFGEGAATLILKRLSDAQRDGDEIQAVLRGTAVNHGGRSAASLTTPSGASQSRLIQAALNSSRLEPSDIDYVEAHGTATRLGDPIEAMSLSEVFSGRRSGQSPLFIGSVKSNIGHTQAAAGIASILKVVLSMQNQMLPRTLHVAEPTPMIDWEEGSLALVLQNQPWKTYDDTSRRAGVSSFGIGGTNSHVIIEQAPARNATSGNVEDVPLVSILPILVSGNTNAALRGQLQRLRRHFMESGGRDPHALTLANVAFSLATSRTHFQHRLAIMARGQSDLLEKLDTLLDQPRLEAAPNIMIGRLDNARHAENRLAMIFSGQGSQVIGMGAGLARVYPVFQKALEEVVSHFTGLDTPLLQVMWADADSENAALLKRTDYAQPAIFAVQVALWRLWCSWDVRPQALLGHSVGEIAAVHAAGILDLKDACRLVSARSRLMQNLIPHGQGSMASLGADATEVANAITSFGLQNSVCIAAVNAPSQTVVSGDGNAVNTLTEHFAEQMGRRTSKLNVSHAFHSHHMDPMLEAFRIVIEALTFNRPTINIVSSLTGKAATEDQLQTTEYWLRQLRMPVQFRDGITTLYEEEQVNIFVEVGARSVLLGMAAACFEPGVLEGGDMPTLLPSLMTGKKDDALTIQQTLTSLHLQDVPVKWDRYFEPFSCRRVDLPTYAFQRQKFKRVKASVTSSIQNHSQSVEKQSLDIDQMDFEVHWQATAKRDISRLANTSWGYISLVDDAEPLRDLELAFAEVGAQLKVVQQIEEVKDLDGLLCLWTDSSSTPVPQRAFQAATVALAQIQQATKSGSIHRIIWVVREAALLEPGSSDEDEQARLIAGALRGLMRTARSEHPDLPLHMLYMDHQTEMVESLPVALSAMANEPECAVIHGEILVPRLQRAANTHPDAATLRSDGAILITGGLGGIGRQLSRWLVSTHGIHDLVVTSRSGMSSPGASNFRQEIERLGASVEIVACNVADRDSLQRVISLFNTERPLRGIIHAAGVVDNGVLSGMTPDRFAATFDPKVFGTWNLHELTQGMDLDIFMVFSSIAGVLGMPGLGNYAAANTFMDALAEMRRSRGLQPHRWHMAFGAVMPLQPQDALALFDRAVGSRRALTVAAKLDPSRLLAYLREDSTDGEIPAFYTSLAGVNGSRSHDSKSGHNDSRTGRLLEALAVAPRQDHTSIVLSMIQETVARALGHDSIKDIDVDLPLQDIGFDSLTAVMLRNQLTSLTGLRKLTTSTIVWDHTSLRALSSFLQSQIQEQILLDTDTSTTSQKVPGEAPNGTNGTISFSAAVEKGLLDPSLDFSDSSTPQRPKAVFITGATGFLGAFVLHELLTLGIDARCLVRASDRNHGRERLEKALRDYDLWKPTFANNLHAIVGDTSRPLFGLHEDDFEDLAHEIDAICHSAALVDWMRPLKDYIGPNVCSAHEVLRLASRGRAQGRTISVHVISTLATLPMHLGYEVAPREREYGYSTSKFMAEQMVSAARWRGAKASVYRVPFVTASAVSGHFRQNRGDFLHNLIAGSVEMGHFPTLRGADLSVVHPVDYLARTIVDVMVENRSQIGHDFDFVNKNAISANRFFEMMTTRKDDQIQLLPFDVWKQLAFDYAVANPRSSLARIAPVIDNLEDERMASEMLESLQTGDHVFGGDVYPAPIIDDEIAQRYADRITAAILK